MVAKRHLPKAVNPLIAPEDSPDLEQLIERRRLGRTVLTANAGHLGVANGTKADNLGVFDYAHLRVPLPKNLEGSGIHEPHKHTGLYPESYFLMRRSSDGYVSATGMFKASFPWASLKEEKNERDYHESLSSGGGEEIAGNVWVDPREALSLADEYGMRHWILALLDPEPIEKGTKVRDEIATPPKFALKDVHLPPPTSAKGSTRKRSTRSASPSKIATPVRKIASPRKPRTSRKKKADEGLGDGATAASDALQAAISNGVEPIHADGAADSADVVKVSVDEVVTKEGDKEITKTSVVIDLPANQPDLPLPENTDDMIAMAKEIVEATRADEAAAAQANGVAAPTTRKRKVDEIEKDDEDVQEAAAELPVAKRAKVAEEVLKKERVKTRAMIGAGLTLAIGAAISHFF